MNSHASRQSTNALRYEKAKDYDLIKEIEKLVANVRYWDDVTSSYMRNTELMDTYMDGRIIPNTFYLDKVLSDRVQMILSHPQRLFLDPKVVELEVDALMALKRAHIALIGKKPSMAKKLLRQAKQLIEQSNATNPERKVDPRSKGGKAAAEIRQARMKPIVEYCAHEITHGNLTDAQVGSKPVLAEELLKRAKQHFRHQLDQLPAITFSTMTGWLKPATDGKEQNQVRQAYEALVKSRGNAATRSSSRKKAGNR
jgi:hypothetical protein